MTRIAVCAWAGMGNVGDDWLLETCLRQLPSGLDIELLLEPGAVSDWPLEVTRWPRVRRVRDVRRLLAFARELNERLDAIVFAGGGWLAGDQGVRSPARWLLRLIGVKVPVLGLGLGCGPFEGLATRALGRAVLRKFDRLSVRTEQDRAWVESLSGRSPEVIGDLSFLALDAPRASTPRREGVVVCMPRPREHWWQGGIEEYRAATTHLARTLARGEQVTHVSFQQGDGHSDSAFWRDEGIIDLPTAAHAADIMSESRIVIAGRLHAAICAAGTGAAVIAMGYHHKFDVLRDLGIDPSDMATLSGKNGPEQPAVADPERIAESRRRAAQYFASVVADVL